MADDPEAMDLLAGYLAQALMTYTLCYAPQKIIIGGGVADHTPIVPLARKKCAEMLNGYIVTPEVNDIVVKSARNIPGVVTSPAKLINVYDLLNAKTLVIDKDALAVIEEVFA